MYIDKKVLYTISVISMTVLLLAFLLPGEYSGRIVCAVLLLPLAIVTSVYIKKRGVPSVNNRSVLMLISVIGVVYLLTYYLSGLAFGYYSNLYLLNFGYIIPISVIIVSSELIRLVIRAQEDKVADVLCYINCVFAEALIFGNIHYITNFNRFMDFVGNTLLPAIIANLLYHYLVRRYGAYPNIVYRLIITLYAYLVPVVPALPDSLFAFAKLFVPILIYLFIDALYERKRKYALKKKNRLTVPLTVLAVAIMTAFIMLISNQFRFGALVIATDSMSGEINKGDIVIFDQKEDQTYTKGQVIVFEKDGLTVVHRIIKIERINGANRYYTKGDSNSDEDSGYITDSDIVGSAKTKLPYFGYPTLWLRKVVSSATQK